MGLSIIRVGDYAFRDDLLGLIEMVILILLLGKI
jgi:hypothetical protein